MELSTKLISKLSLVNTSILLALQPSLNSTVAFACACVVISLQAYLDQRDVRINDDTKRQIKELKEMFEAFKLAGMRR